jgi:hypothetical protein
MAGIMDLIRIQNSLIPGIIDPCVSPCDKGDNIIITAGRDPDFSFISNYYPPGILKRAYPFAINPIC